MDKRAINQARSFYYSLFASLFAFDENLERRFKGVEERLELMVEHPIDSVSQEAAARMLERIRTIGFEKVAEEFDAIFYDLAHDPVPTTASFYTEERDDGRMRRKMLEYTLESSYRRNKDLYTDLEDDLGFILPFMAVLIDEEMEGNEKSAFLEREVFRTVLNEFVDEFIDNVRWHESADFYRDAAQLLEVFMELERSHLDLRKPPERLRIERETEELISDAEAKRRMENKRKKSEALSTCVIEVGGDVEDEV